MILGGTLHVSTRPRPLRIASPDARIIMGDDIDKVTRLWREKRGESKVRNLKNSLVDQLDRTTEGFSRAFYERSSGHTVKDINWRIRHPVHKWMGAVVEGRVQETGAVFKTEFMPSGQFCEQAVADRYMAQLQHSMWVIAARSALLSIITEDGEWIEVTVHADPLYQHLLLTAEKKFLRCVQTGEPPILFDIEAPSPSLASIKTIDISASRQWTDLVATCFKIRGTWKAR